VIKVLTSQFYDEREPEARVDTIILHSMYNPEKENGLSVTACKECLDSYQVSAHYFIDREGGVWQAVPEDKRAWHAGKSTMPEDGRESVNGFSIGIELIGTETSGYTEDQYKSLSLLTRDIMSRHEIKFIYGHSDIAPGRKTDPWNFDWQKFKSSLNLSSTHKVQFSL